MRTGCISITKKYNTPHITAALKLIIKLSMFISLICLGVCSSPINMIATHRDSLSTKLKV